MAGAGLVSVGGRDMGAAGASQWNRGLRKCGGVFDFLSAPVFTVYTREHRVQSRSEVERLEPMMGHVGLPSEHSCTTTSCPGGSKVQVLAVDAGVCR